MSQVFSTRQCGPRRDGKLLAQVLVREPACDEHEHQHRIENGLCIVVAEAQRGSPLAWACLKGVFERLPTLNHLDLTLL